MRVYGIRGFNRQKQPITWSSFPEVTLNKTLVYPENNHIQYKKCYTLHLRSVAVCFPSSKSISRIQNLSIFIREAVWTRCHSSSASGPEVAGQHLQLHAGFLPSHLRRPTHSRPPLQRLSCCTGTSSVPVGAGDHEAHVVHVPVSHPALGQLSWRVCGRTNISVLSKNYNKYK